MDYEKKYNERLDSARYWRDVSEGDIPAVLEEIFPELRESEDERIRKALLNAMSDYTPDSIVCDGVRAKDIIAWLEKQGEQKSINDTDEKIVEAMKDTSILDMVEPKFKVGDWITSDEGYINEGYRLCKIIGISDGCYTIQTINGYKGYNTFKMWENEYRLWSIADAKPGDVLANDNEIVIYKESNFNQKDLSGCMFVHCSLRDKNGYWYTIGGINPSNYIPATKEQREQLKKAMISAGYTFDFEKKELKKLKFKVGDEVITENEESLTITKIDEEGYWSNDLFICDFDSECNWDLVEQKPAWSEEDENGLGDALWCCKQAASIAKDENDMGNVWYAGHWLKSLKDRHTWKPSEKQIEALEDEVRNNKTVFRKKVLNELLEQLKKL